MLHVRLPLAAALLLCTAACQSTTTPIQYATDVLPSGGLSQAQPADIAVPPVRNGTDAAVPVEGVRLACYTGLVDRLYSPVSLDYVDRTWTDASYGGAGAADAVLDIEVTKWDTTHVSSRGIVIARAEARLLDARNPDGKPLWAVGVTRRLDLGGPNPSAGWESLAADLLADQILTQLPERDPVRAHR
ncbi:MAG: hypothetical protein AAF682_26210 [Planctomycetota bacterium]